MSRENVEPCQAAYDAFNRRDFDALLAIHADDVEVTPLAAAVSSTYPVAGRMVFEHAVFHPAESPEQRLALYSALPEAVARRSWLGCWTTSDVDRGAARSS